ncbi:PREDICTED: 5-hydroxytryptamine receptor 3A-like [Cyprinodon variegatus]|uniref:5-hydroxytryptamine receptor 3A-like n=1 Tax=Cyprinodon variegatus TaxID=28743 RepID=UPI000742BF73|nr:PREDICTED: 5-hydroxytryptamine receptor 3A-like [Cyprinodon variegatus]
MAALWIPALVMFAAGVCSSLSSDCTYYGLLEHLNLTTSNAALEIMRPVKNWRNTTVVSLDMVLYGILGIVSVQLFQCYLFFLIEKHFYTPVCYVSKFGISRVVFSTSDSGSIHEDPWVVLQQNGEINSFARQRVTFTCILNLHKFPFDKQNCNITFLSMNADVKTLLLRSSNNGSSTLMRSGQFMATQGEWGLKNIDIIHDHLVGGEKNSSLLVYTVLLERKPFLYIINFVVPLVYLLVLDLASFFISVDSGEKFGFKVTVLLSVSVLLLILQDILPSTEDDLPMIANLCVGVFTLVWLSVLESMLVSFLYNLDRCCQEKNKSSIVGKVLKKKATKGQKEGDSENGEVKPEQGALPLGQLGHADLLKQVLEELKAAQQEAGGQRSPGFYTRVAIIIDTLFFVGYILAFAAFVIYICVGWVDI